MPRTMWAGLISFGMVSIPVKLYTATESKSVSFHQLHGKCNTRIREQRFCPHCERTVEYDELVKGYEYAKDRYVVVTDEDLEKLPLPSKHVIEVKAFVQSAEIDPVYFDKSYYLEPDEAALRPFALFMKALNDRSVVGIGTIAIRSKERLCALRPLGGTLMLETLLYADEIRVSADNPLPDVKISSQEMKMALSLVDLMSDKFEPDAYKDHYRHALTKLLEAKLEGEEIVEAPTTSKGKVVDLMEALRASLESAHGGKAQPKRSAARAARSKQKPAAKRESKARKQKPKAAATKKKRGAA
jgi:DNA end-binding protein Ku